MVDYTMESVLIPSKATPEVFKTLPRPTTLSIELLETFVTLVQHDGDAGQTARALGINQPSMSKRMAHLNQSGEVLKRPWLVREGKTWLLTEEGQRVLPVVRELIERYHTLYGYTRKLETPHPTVRFACGQTTATGLVRRALERFRAKHPEIPIRISTMRGPQRIEGVASGALDLALVSRSAEEINEIARADLYIEELTRVGYSLVCAKDSPWAKAFRKLPKKKPVTLTQACEFPLITPEPDSRTRQVFDEALQRHASSARPELFVQTGGWLTILNYVRDGHGAGLISNTVLKMVSDTKWMQLRTLQPRQMAPVPLNLIARLAPDRPHDLDLTEDGHAWRKCLRANVR